MLAAIGLLDEISRRCLAGDALSQDQAYWLGGALRRFLTRQCRTIEEALGICSGRGGVPWRMELAIRRRDAALGELARRFLSNLSCSAQAKAIRKMCVRYAASAWLSDRHSLTMPNSYADMPQEWLWQAFTAGAPIPISERQLRKILPPTVPANPKGAIAAVHSFINHRRGG